MKIMYLNKLYISVLVKEYGIIVANYIIAVLRI